MSTLGRIDSGGRGGAPVREASPLQVGDDATVASGVAEAARGAKLRPLLALLPYVARYRGRALCALVALVVAALTTLVVPIADGGFPRSTSKLVWPLAVTRVTSTSLALGNWSNQAKVMSVNAPGSAQSSV